MRFIGEPWSPALIKLLSTMRDGEVCGIEGTRVVKCGKSAYELEPHEPSPFAPPVSAGLAGPEPANDPLVDFHSVTHSADAVGVLRGEPADPWKHRSARMSCQTCMWFNAKAPRTDFGRCRRHAPTMSGFPAVYGTDWCGDHKLDEKHA